MTDDKKSKATTLAHGGRRKEWRGRLVNPAVERGSTILFDDVAELNRARPGLGQWNYGLQGTANGITVCRARQPIGPCRKR
jgi:cystathionine beta-lyase/cystathionine gamma-synthase